MSNENKEAWQQAVFAGLTTDSLEQWARQQKPRKNQEYGQLIWENKTAYTWLVKHHVGLYLCYDISVAPLVKPPLENHMCIRITPKDLSTAALAAGRQG